MFSALRSVESDHDELLRLLNRVVCQDEDGRFVTLVLASVAPADDGTATLRLTSAGHPPPLILRADGRVEVSSTRGSLIGVMPEATALTHSTVLRPGETCLLYSDGITEARGSGPDGELFGDERLAALLSGCVGMPPEAVVERVEMLTAQWLGGQEHDDIAMVAISIPCGRPGPRPPIDVREAEHMNDAFEPHPDDTRDKTCHTVDAARRFRRALIACDEEEAVGITHQCLDEEVPRRTS
ncbi:PP2C family protein-serine/threonine phosphatase [Streptomyces sp. M19]